MIGSRPRGLIGLDPDTAERILIGTVAPDDAPPGYARATALLRSLTAPPTVLELARERETVRAMAATLSRPPARRGRLTRKLVLLGAVALIGGGSALATVGADRGHRAPAPNRPTPAATASRYGGGVVPGESGMASDDGAGMTAGDHRSSSMTKGARISKLARETTASGVEKGAEISTAASGGTSQAGMHGKATASHGSTPDSQGSPPAGRGGLMRGRLGHPDVPARAGPWGGNDPRGGRGTIRDPTEGRSSCRSSSTRISASETRRARRWSSIATCSAAR